VGGKPTTIFLSFRHRERDTFVSGQVAADFIANGRRFRGRRILDKPTYGVMFQDEIDRNLLGVDGMISFWSREASESFYVNYEVYRASELKIPVCLVKYDGVDLPSWWGSQRHAIVLKGIDAKDPDNGMPWTDLGAQIGKNEFRTIFLNGCLDFAGTVRRGNAAVIPGIPKPETWEYGLGWKPEQKACPIHNWAVRVVHTSYDINRMVHRDILKVECGECAVCQRALAFSRSRASGVGDQGSAWSELQTAVQLAHGP
jgi:hypothetical protein